MRRGLALMAALAFAASAGHAKPARALAQAAAGDPSLSYTYRVLNNPRTGDAFLFRNAVHDYTQQRSNRIFQALASLLGGTAPELNFVPTGSDLTPNHMSANFKDVPGAAAGTMNVDPLAAYYIAADATSGHSVAINQLPHEDAHLRQTTDVLSSIPNREGSAQAFADIVTPSAAQQAHIPYVDGNYDGTYADYVKQAQARGRDWLLAGQFGKPGSPVWP